MKKKEYIKPETETMAAVVFIQPITASGGDPLTPIPENAPRYNARDDSNTDSPIEDMTYESQFE